MSIFAPLGNTNVTRGHGVQNDVFSSNVTVNCDPRLVVPKLGLAGRKNALYKDDFEDFKIPESIYLTSLNYDTGQKSIPGDKITIIEALKYEDINNTVNNNLISTNGRDTLIKFRQFY